MIKVNENFSIDRDQHNWIVLHGRNKSYHPTLEKCLSYIRDIELGECDTVEAILTRLQASYRLDALSVDRFVKRAAIN